MNIDQVTPTMCAELAYFFFPNYELIRNPNYDEENRFNLFKDNRDIGEFHPTNERAYFLLKRAIESHKKVKGVSIIYDGIMEAIHKYQCVIWTNIYKDSSPIIINKETEILALFLAAYELMKRIKANG